jgi:hypothetical protein
MLQQSIDMIFVSVSSLIFVGFVFLQNSLGNISELEENNSSFSSEKKVADSKNKSFLKKRKK